MELNLTDVYMERCDKDTEDVISEEKSSFLSTPIKYLKQNTNEFLYIESTSFEPIKADSITFELDDVFKTYTVLFGLKVQKKYAQMIKTYLDENLKGEDVFYSCAFSGEDGLWDVNIPIDFIEGFTEELTIEETLTMTFNFLKELVNALEQQ